MQEVLPFSHRSKVFSADQLRELDRQTIEKLQVSPAEFIEQVALRLWEKIVAKYGINQYYTIFCGTGNNGSDGLALAGHLHKLTRTQVEVFCVKTSKQPTDEFNALLPKMPFPVQWIESDSLFEIGGSVVVDCLLGSGTTRPAEGLLAQVIEKINASGKTIVSIDVASGLYTEGNLGGAVVKPHLTLSLEAMKPAFFYAENEPYTGEVHIVEIGLNTQAKESIAADTFFVHPYDLQKLLKLRSKFAHKGTFGKALLIAGSRTMSGAAVLAALGCLRSGVGLLNVHSTQTHALPPEVLTSQDPNPDHWSIVPRDFHNYTAIGVGSGIGTHGQTLTALEATIELIENRPLVLDADALNLLHAKLLEKLKPNTILTPHPKEFDRLTKGHKSSRERIETAREFAVNNSLIVCLKGAYTATCLPSGRVIFNSSGNPGMATAGSGDVLTGVILGLLAQGYPPQQAAVLGVYLHGLAGDIAAENQSQESLIASDIAHSLGQAFGRLRSYKQEEQGNW